MHKHLLQINKKIFSIYIFQCCLSAEGLEIGVRKKKKKKEEEAMFIYQIRNGARLIENGKEYKY